MRGWVASARAAQEQFLRRIAASGATITAEHRYVRVLNAVAARLDPTSLEMLERDREVVAVYPVRVAYPTATDVSPGVPVAVPASVPGLGVPGLEGRGVVVALLDTGVDQSHPFLRESVTSGIDVITPGSGAIAQPHPTIPRRPERHGTELAGVVAGSEGPEGSTASPRARRSCRFAWRAGSPTPRGDTRSTRAPIRCSPGSRRRSTRTTTATRTTQPASRSSASPSRTHRSRTGRSRARSRGRRRSTRSSSCPQGTTGMRGRRSEASPGLVVRPPRSRSEPWTAGRHRRPCASTCARRCGCSSTACSRSGARRTAP